jgi:Cu(I)/Ag(I) efflux system periplasmic protein CusF
MIRKLLGTLLLLFATAAMATSHYTEGEIRKIDKDAGKLTLRHGEIRNLDMPGMTMVFGVKDKAMLEGVAVGDKVKFRAEKIDSAYVVTEIARIK